MYSTHLWGRRLLDQVGLVLFSAQLTEQSFLNIALQSKTMNRMNILTRQSGPKQYQDSTAPYTYLQMRLLHVVREVEGLIDVELGLQCCLDLQWVGAAGVNESLLLILSRYSTMLANK
jgi:hypothetical protein